MYDVKIRDGDIVLDVFYNGVENIQDVEAIESFSEYLAQFVHSVQNTYLGELAFRENYGMDIPLVYSQMENLATNTFVDYINRRLRENILNSLGWQQPISVSQRLDGRNIIVEITHEIQDRKTYEIRYSF